MTLTPATWSSWLCAFGFGEGLHEPVRHTAVPVDRLWACSGVSRAWSGSRLEPSPTDAKDLCFWFLIERMKPFTTTFSVSSGPLSRMCAMEAGMGALGDPDVVWMLQLRRFFDCRNDRCQHWIRRGCAIICCCCVLCCVLCAVCSLPVFFASVSALHLFYFIFWRLCPGTSCASGVDEAGQRQSRILWYRDG